MIKAISPINNGVILFFLIIYPQFGHELTVSLISLPHSGHFVRAIVTFPPCICNCIRFSDMVIIP